MDHQPYRQGPIASRIGRGGSWGPRVPVPITKYMVSDKPSAFLDFQILYAWGKKAEVVSMAAKKPMYSGSIILNDNIDNLIGNDDYSLGYFSVQIGLGSVVFHYSSFYFILTQGSA